MITVKLQGRMRGIEPLLSSGLALVVQRRFDTDRGQLGFASPDQRPRVGVSLQHYHVGLADIARQWRDRQQFGGRGL